MRHDVALRVDVTDDACPVPVKRRKRHGCGLTYHGSCASWPLLVRLLWWALRSRDA